MITMLKFAGIPVKNQDAAFDFYTKKLGFLVVTNEPLGPGKRWIELRPPQGETGISLNTPSGHEPRVGQFQSLTFMCDDIETTYRELVERGVTFESPLTKERWGSYAIIKDPDGNSFLLSST